MSESSTKSKITSWAVPGKADDALWESMTREEQLAAYQEHFNSPGFSTPSGETMDEIIQRVSRKIGPGLFDD